MFSLFRKRNVVAAEEHIILELPLENIKKIDESGILYIDNEGNSNIINYSEAYKGWCKSKNIRKTKLKYIGDRMKSEGKWKLIFYTNPQIIFLADVTQVEFRIDILNKLTKQGFPTFDWD